MNDIPRKTCGTCAFGIIHAQDLTKRLCHGNPPQILVLPTPPQFKPGPPGQPPVMVSPGGFSLQNARPIVPATDPACSHYEPRSMMQLAQDNNGTVEAKPETKQ